MVRLGLGCGSGSGSGWVGLGLGFKKIKHWGFGVGGGWLIWSIIATPNWTQSRLGLILAQAPCVRHACLHAPCITWPLLSPSFGLQLIEWNIGPASSACANRGGVAMRSLPLLLPNFGLLSFCLRLLLLTHFGESPVYENLFPQIFWPN